MRKTFFYETIFGHTYQADVAVVCVMGSFYMRVFLGYVDSNAVVQQFGECPLEPQGLTHFKPDPKAPPEFKKLPSGLLQLIEGELRKQLELR